MTEQTPDGTKQERAWREWTAIGLGVTGLLSIVAVIISLAALSASSKTTTTTIAQAAATVPAAPAPAPVHMTMAVKTDTEHGKRGPDGAWHDAFLPADFSVKAGQSVTITVSNYDNSPHSFTAPSLGLDQRIPGGSEKAPHTITFTFKAPSQPGSYEWWCSLPCDPWAMTHNGYMRGYITVKA